MPLDPSIVAAKAESRTEAMSAVLAELNAPPEPVKAVEPVPTPEPVVEPVKAEAEEPSIPEPEAEPAVEAKAEPEETDEPSIPEPTSEPAKKPAVDPETARKLDILHKASKKANDDRAALAQDRAALAADLAAVKQFRALAARAAVDPIGVLRALGIKETEHERIGRRFLLASSKAAQDPKLRDAAEREMRVLEHEDRVAELEGRLMEVTERLESKERAEQSARYLNDYLDKSVQLLGDGTPLLKSMQAKSPAKLRMQLGQVAQALMDETGEVPSHEDVVKTLENQRRAELEELGVDLSQYLKTKTPTPNAGEKKSAKTLSNNLSTPTPVRGSAKSREEEMADVRLALERGALE